MERERGRERKLDAAGDWAKKKKGKGHVQVTSVQQTQRGLAETLQRRWQKFPERARWWGKKWSSSKINSVWRTAGSHYVKETQCVCQSNLTALFRVSLLHSNLPPEAGATSSTSHRATDLFCLRVSLKLKCLFDWIKAICRVLCHYSPSQINWTCNVCLNSGCLKTSCFMWKIFWKESENWDVKFSLLSANQLVIRKVVIPKWTI